MLTDRVWALVGRVGSGGAGGWVGPTVAIKIRKEEDELSPRISEIHID